MALPIKSVLTIATCGFVLQISVLLAQDDSAAPAPTDYSAPMTGADQATGAVSTNDGSSAQDDSASFQTFYDGLANQGTWIQTSDYGYVWQPQESDPDWAPYTVGHWVYSDDGWTWVSDEPWGWATYHYGRWVNIEGTGWVWVPGYTWAPAWVSWRYGNGYAGWAPLPPDSFVGVDYSSDDESMDVGYHIGGDCDDYYGIGPAYYIFLPVSCLCYHNYHGYYRHRYDNYGIINSTTNVTSINVNRKRNGDPGHFHHVTTGGPELAQVNAASQSPIQQVSLVRTNRPGGGTLTGSSLALYAPHIKPGTTAGPSRVGSSIGQVKINRGADITQPLAVNAQLAPTAPTQSQVEQARAAQSQAPAGAKVLTDAGSFRPVLQTPVTSMKPIVVQAAATHTFETNPNAVSRPQGGAPSQIYLSPTRTFPQTGNEENMAPSHIISNSTPTYPSGPSAPQRTITNSGEQESRVYERPAAPVSSGNSAPVVHESAPVSPGSGRTESSAGPSQSSGGSLQSSGGAGISAGASSGPPSKNH